MSRASIVDRNSSSTNEEMVTILDSWEAQITYFKKLLRGCKAAQSADIPSLAQ